MSHQNYVNPKIQIVTLADLLRTLPNLFANDGEMLCAQDKASTVRLFVIIRIKQMKFIVFAQAVCDLIYFFFRHASI